jgi:hypothetical protein
MKLPYIHGLEPSLAEEVRQARTWAESKGLPKAFDQYIGQTRAHFWFGSMDTGETIKVKKPKLLIKNFKRRE